MWVLLPFPSGEKAKGLALPKVLAYECRSLLVQSIEQSMLP